jgi:hypothetical protein
MLTCLICNKADSFLPVCDIDAGKRQIMACECGYQMVYPPPFPSEMTVIAWKP